MRETRRGDKARDCEGRGEVTWQGDVARGLGKGCFKGISEGRGGDEARGRDERRGEVRGEGTWQEDMARDG